MHSAIAPPIRADQWARRGRHALPRLILRRVGSDGLGRPRLRLFNAVLNAAAIERLHDLNVGTTPVQEGTPHEKPHKPLLLMAAFDPNDHPTNGLPSARTTIGPWTAS
ncbi:MAG: hypothetical protein NTW21_04565 [Verrucomicrobia bacterium]|nr:hypothetical protein [Verrucomicrobiota bacterium]